MTFRDGGGSTLTVSVKDFFKTDRRRFYIIQWYSEWGLDNPTVLDQFMRKYQPIIVENSNGQMD